jgi:two-component system NtrC family sensor kinase
VAAIIQDNGAGMSEDTLKHIFEPFFTTKKEYGTGLGLPITYGIVNKLGGDLKVQSQQGKGTMFTIFLPKNSRDHALGRR